MQAANEKLIINALGPYYVDWKLPVIDDGDLVAVVNLNSAHMTMAWINYRHESSEQKYMVTQFRALLIKWGTTFD